MSEITHWAEMPTFRPTMLRGSLLRGLRNVLSMRRSEAGARSRIDPLWQAWLTETCDPYAWRRLDAAVARFAGTGSVLEQLLSWQDTGTVPSPNLAWALGEALYECGVSWASGVLSLWVAGYLGEIVALMATCGGRWPQIVSAAPEAVTAHHLPDAGEEPEPVRIAAFRRIVTLTPKEREATRDAWTAWGGVAHLPAQTSGYYRGLSAMVADFGAPLEERRRLLQAVVEADLPPDWRRVVIERARDAHDAPPNAA